MVNNKKILAIILARSGSSRLKNKVLLKINQSTILDIFIKRLTNCKNIDKIILATSKNQNDKKIIKIAKKNKINFYVGDEQDVLGRVCNAISDQNTDFDYIVRANSDCPLIMPHILDQDIKNFINSNFDIFSPFYKNMMPLGFSSVIFKRNILLKINHLAKKSKYREHIENFCFDNKRKFKILTSKKIKKLYFPKLSFLLDTKKDFYKIKILFKSIKGISFKKQPHKLIEKFL